MGMGFAGAYADVVEVETIEKFCKKEYKAFMDSFSGSSTDLETFAQNASYSLDDEDANVVWAYNDLCEAFNEKTGLDLGLSFHSASDEGDRYDDVDGAYWCVEGMYALTPAGEKMKKFVERKHFVQFG